MSCRDHAFTHVLKTCHGPDTERPLGPNSAGGRQAGSRGVHVIWLQELMVTLGRTVSREAEGEGEERGQGDRED